MSEFLKVFILKYRLDVGSILMDDDKAKALFNEKTIDLENKVNSYISNRCFYVILGTALAVALLYAGILSAMHDTRKANILQYIGDFIK